MFVPRAAQLQAVAKYIVYGLIDPITHQLRYVGLSTCGMNRPLQHFGPSGRRGRSYVKNWLAHLHTKHRVRPEIEILETCDTLDQLNEAEIFWIAYFRYIGCNLTNLKPGGKAATGWTVSEATRAKMSAAHRGQVVSQATREKLSKANKGSTHSVATRLKMSRTRKGMTYSAERNAKLSASKQGHSVSAETRAKIRASLLKRRNKI